MVRKIMKFRCSSFLEKVRSTNTKTTQKNDQVVVIFIFSELNMV